MIIKGIITVLNRQHPCAEQEPEYRGYRLPNAGNKVEQQQHDGARQIPGQLLPLTLHNPRNIFHDAKDADVRRGSAGQARFQLFRQQAAERRGYPVGDRRKK